MLKRNPDLAVSAGSAAVLLAVHAAWPFWIAWAAIVAFQAANRIRARA